MLKRAVLFNFVLFAVAPIHWAWASGGDDDEVPVKPKIFGAHYGYTFEIADEKNRRDVEMEMLAEPKEPRKPIKEIIFNEKLSKEFQEQYRIRFGQTETEQRMNSPGRFDEYTYYHTQEVTVQDYQNYQRQFAEYMGRRLVEYHADNYFKNDRDLRPVYEMKDRVSNATVNINHYKFVWKYNFSGPSMDLSVDNPYKIEAKVRMEMSGIISKPKEFIYTVTYPFSTRVKVTAVYKEINTLYQLIWARKLNRKLTISLTGSVGAISTTGGASSTANSSSSNGTATTAGPTQRQQLFLVGINWKG